LRKRDRIELINYTVM